VPQQLVVDLAVDGDPNPFLRLADAGLGGRTEIAVHHQVVEPAAVDEELDRLDDLVLVTLGRQGPVLGVEPSFAIAPRI
jgi:hypothetical protein